MGERDQGRMPPPSSVQFLSFACRYWPKSCRIIVFYTKLTLLENPESATGINEYVNTVDSKIILQNYILYWGSGGTEEIFNCIPENGSDIHRFPTVHSAFSETFRENSFVHWSSENYNNVVCLNFILCRFTNFYWEGFPPISGTYLTSVIKIIIILKRLFEPSTSCISDKNATTGPLRQR